MVETPKFKANLAPWKAKVSRSRSRKLKYTLQAKAKTKEIWPRPPLNYCILITLALYNSAEGSLTVQQIYQFTRYLPPSQLLQCWDVGRGGVRGRVTKLSCLVLGKEQDLEVRTRTESGLPGSVLSSARGSVCDFLSAPIRERGCEDLSIKCPSSGMSRAGILVLPPGKNEYCFFTGPAEPPASGHSLIAQGSGKNLSHILFYFFLHPHDTWAFLRGGGGGGGKNPQPPAEQSVQPAFELSPVPFSSPCRHHFPFFQTAPDGWKNTIRHNLCFSRSFEKTTRFVCSEGKRKARLWKLTTDGRRKFEEEMQALPTEALALVHQSMNEPGTVQREQLLSEWSRQEEQSLETLVRELQLGHICACRALGKEQARLNG